MLERAVLTGMKCHNESMKLTLLSIKKELFLQSFMLVLISSFRYFRRVKKDLNLISNNVLLRNLTTKFDVKI